MISSPIKDKNYNSNKIYFVVCKCFQFNPVQNFVIWNRVNPPFDSTWLCDFSTIKKEKKKQSDHFPTMVSQKVICNGVKHDSTASINNGLLTKCDMQYIPVKHLIYIQIDL